MKFLKDAMTLLLNFHQFRSEGKTGGIRIRLETLFFIDWKQQKPVLTTNNFLSPEKISWCRKRKSQQAKRFFQAKNIYESEWGSTLTKQNTFKEKKHSAKNTVDVFHKY